MMTKKKLIFSIFLLFNMKLIASSFSIIVIFILSMLPGTICIWEVLVSLKRFLVEMSSSTRKRIYCQFHVLQTNKRVFLMVMNMLRFDRISPSDPSAICGKLLVSLTGTFMTISLSEKNGIFSILIGLMSYFLAHLDLEKFTLIHWCRAASVMFRALPRFVCRAESTTHHWTRGYLGEQVVDQLTLPDGTVVHNQSFAVAEFSIGFEGSDGLLGWGFCFRNTVTMWLGWLSGSLVLGQPTSHAVCYTRFFMPLVSDSSTCRVAVPRLQGQRTDGDR